MPTETPELPINIQPLAQRVGEKLFDARTVLIFGEIDSRLAREVTAQLLALAATSDERITIYLHSQGGHVESADTVFDVLDFVKPKVAIVGTGWVASAGAHIYLGVPKEQRYCLPNTRFLLHQPWGGAGGRASDLEIEAEEILKMRARLSRIIAERTGQPLKRVEKDTERNFWMSAEQARDYGLVGEIITSADQIRTR
jgi:ATP-dependent Clp protease protease subunit